MGNAPTFGKLKSMHGPSGVAACDDGCAGALGDLIPLKNYEDSVSQDYDRVPLLTAPVGGAGSSTYLDTLACTATAICLLPLERRHEIEPSTASSRGSGIARSTVARQKAGRTARRSKTSCLFGVENG